MRLSEKYRPKTFDDLYGNTATITMLKNLLDKPNHPQTFILTGGAGTGKTTTSGIIANYLNANIADCSADMGVDMVAEIGQAVRTISDFPRIFRLDECHRLSAAAIERLKVLIEAPYPNNYFILITDRPENVDKALLQRCTMVKLEPLSEPDTLKLLKSVCEKEGITADKVKLVEIAEIAEGCARNAIKYLEMLQANPEAEVSDFGNNGKDEENPEVFDIVKLLYSGKDWRNLSIKLDAAKKANLAPETIRRTALSYGCTMLLKGNKNAAKVLQQLSTPYENGSTGWPMFALDCYLIGG